MNKRSLQQGFIDFIFALYQKTPEELPENQKRDLEFAFMAGAVCTNELNMSILDHTQEESMQIISDLCDELSDYGEKLQKLIDY